MTVHDFLTKTGSFLLSCVICMLDGTLLTLWGLQNHVHNTLVVVVSLDSPQWCKQLKNCNENRLQQLGSGLNTKPWAYGVKCSKLIWPMLFKQRMLLITFHYHRSIACIPADSSVDPVGQKADSFNLNIVVLLQVNGAVEILQYNFFFPILTPTPNIYVYVAKYRSDTCV